jgi:hypothetical protein
MPSLPLLDESQLNLLVSYSISSEQEVTEAVIDAFLAGNIDVYEKPTTLVDWVNVDVLENIRWTADGPVYLSTRIWDHQVVITAEEVRIYATAGR